LLLKIIAIVIIIIIISFDDVTYVGIDLLRNLNPSKIKVMVAKRSKKKSTKTPEMIRIIGSFELKSPDPTEKKFYSTNVMLLGMVAIG
jgi:hypothetical protein